MQKLDIKSIPEEQLHKMVWSRETCEASELRPLIDRHSLPFTRLRHELIAREGMAGLLHLYYYSNPPYCSTTEDFGCTWQPWMTYPSPWLRPALDFIDIYHEIALADRRSDSSQASPRNDTLVLLSSALPADAVFCRCFEEFCTLEPSIDSYLMLWRLTSATAAGAENAQWRGGDYLHFESIDAWLQALEEVQRRGRDDGGEPRVVPDDEYRRMMGFTSEPPPLLFERFSNIRPGCTGYETRRILRCLYREAAEYLTERSAAYTHEELFEGLHELWARRQPFHVPGDVPYGKEFWPGAKVEDYPMMLEMWRTLGKCPTYDPQMSTTANVQRLAMAARRAFSCYMAAMETMPVPTPVSAILYRTLQVYAEYMITQALADY